MEPATDSNCDLFVTNEVLYLLSYTGEWWGCLTSNQGTQRGADYSPPQLPLCHIPIQFSSTCEVPLHPASEKDNIAIPKLVNVYLYASGRILPTI